MATTLKGKDILHVNDLSKDDVELILDTAARFEQEMEAGKLLNNMAGKVLTTMFYEPSTRTRMSFESAMMRLGGQVISVAEAKTSSSAAKGETLYDTGKMVESYADVGVIRHPVVGSARELADGSSVPVINGGDGAGQHPTQSLLDVYTIKKECGTLEGLTIALAGDLKNGRTVHSLAMLMSMFKPRYYFVAPTALKMPAEITDTLRTKGIDVMETDNLNEAAAASDVLYMTRIQKERFDDPAEYERLKGSYVLTRDIVKEARKGITIMHPLPRVNEIATSVDDYHGAAYFRQAANGVPVRMALLALVTGQE